MTAIGGYRLVVFDCDGTLVDSQHNIVAGMIAAWRRHGLPEPTPEQIRRQVGLTLEIGIARVLDSDDPVMIANLAEAYREIVRALRSRAELHEPLFDGIRELIDALNAPEIFLGVATGKNLVGLEHTLRELGLRERFHTLQTPDHCRSKPDPQMVLRAMAETAVEPAETVVIGDTTLRHRNGPFRRGDRDRGRLGLPCGRGIARRGCRRRAAAPVRIDPSFAIALRQPVKSASETAEWVYADQAPPDRSGYRGGGWRGSHVRHPPVGRFQQL